MRAGDHPNRGESELPPDWTEAHLEAYRDGYHDALLWAWSRDNDEILEVLNADKGPHPYSEPETGA